MMEYAKMDYSMLAYTNPLEVHHGEWRTSEAATEAEAGRTEAGRRREVVANRRDILTKQGPAM
jgi:hypothetical protein